MSLIKGDASPVPQGVSFDFDPRDGLSVSTPFRGEAGAMAGFSATLRAAGVAHSFTSDGAEAEIVLRGSRLNPNDPAEDMPQDEWSVENSSLAFSFYEHPKTLYLERTYPGILSFIKADVEASASGTLTMTPYREKLQGIYTMTVDDGLLADQLIRRLITDGVQYNRESYKLLHTQTIPDTFLEAISDSNVLRLYNYSELETEITDAELAIPCPLRLRTKLSEAFTNLEPNSAYYRADDYFWGFLKSPSNERGVANNKIQITTEYTLELWSRFAYERFSA